MGCTTGFSWVEVGDVAVSSNIQDGHTAKDSPIHIVNRTEIEQACPCDTVILYPERRQYESSWQSSNSETT